MRGSAWRLSGFFWYHSYGRSRAIKESAFRESLRQQDITQLLQLTEEALTDEERHVTVVSGREGRDPTLFRIARPLAGSINLIQPGERPTAKIGQGFFFSSRGSSSGRLSLS